MENSPDSEADLEKIMEESWEEIDLQPEKKKYVHDGSLLTTNEYTAYLVFSIFMLNLYDKSP